MNGAVGGPTPTRGLIGWVGALGNHRGLGFRGLGFRV